MKYIIVILLLISIYLSVLKPIKAQNINVEAADVLPQNDSLFSYQLVSEEVFLRARSKSHQNIFRKPGGAFVCDSFFVIQGDTFLSNNEYEGSYSYVGFSTDLQAWLISYCGESSCADSLISKASGERLPLYANFDQGVMGLELSPSKDKFLTWSSYDVPEFEWLSNHRAEFQIIKLKNGPLVDTKPAISFTTKLWSVEDMVWQNDRSLVLKVYTGIRPEGEGGAGYQYILVNLVGK